MSAPLLIESAKQAGFGEYIANPIRILEVVKAISDHIG
jgi:hypothetical protein|tara:strand:- start:1447 stop:1560 length:114 start_codon:yes stop_codon:yes gene_type:complete